MGNNTQNKAILTREFSSGGVVFKKRSGNVLWLIRRTSPSELFPKSYWMLPKGWLDDLDNNIPGPMARGLKKADEKTLQKVALKEVAEETGVEARVIDKIGTVKFFYTNPQRGRVLKFVIFYLMEWIKDLPGGFDFETSEISWLPFDLAHKTLSYGEEKRMLVKAKDLLALVAQRTE